MTPDELRDRLVAFTEGPIVATTLDELIVAVTFGTDWDFDQAKALFLANLTTSLPDKSTEETP